MPAPGSDRGGCARGKRHRTAPHTERELKVGDKAPDQYKRDELAVRDWRAKGLPAPETDSHWVRLADHYVLVQTTNGVILAIQPAT